MNEILDEELSALIDGELEPEREALLRARIAAEPDLAARVASFEGVDARLRGLPQPALSPDAAAALRARIETEQKPRRLPAWSAGALAAAAAVAVYLVMPGSQPTPGTSSPGSSSPGSSSPGSAGAPEVGLAQASDEEIGIALDYETLADLEVIEDLELLEWMAEQSG